MYKWKFCTSDNNDALNSSLHQQHLVSLPTMLRFLLPLVGDKNTSRRQWEWSACVIIINFVLMYHCRFDPGTFFGMAPLALLNYKTFNDVTLARFANIISSVSRIPLAQSNIFVFSDESQFLIKSTQLWIQICKAILNQN